MRIVEPKIASYSLEIFKKRYAKTDMKGNPLESPGEMLARVAKHMAKAEIYWNGTDKNIVEETGEKFYERMVNLKFVCSGKAMFEAGNEGGTGQLSACFVLAIEDSIPSIFKTLGEAALIQKNNGGTGFNFSKIRPHGDKVRNVPKVASGPVDFIRAYDACLGAILQGGKRHGGNMSILNADHPDIFSFVGMKEKEGVIRNFNLSVGATDAFLEAVEKDKDWFLINPRNKEQVKKIKASDLFYQIISSAQRSGDPGMIFLDRIEEDNPTPTLGKLEATNPCGEQPLLPYESCNLTSVVLSRHLKKIAGGKPSYQIDWEDLAYTVKTAVHFLDNMIEVNTYLLPEVERIVKFGNRKIGLGVMGFAHLLYQLGIPYGTGEAVRLAERLAKFIKKNAEEESLELAKKRGFFPNFDLSIYRGTAERYRQATMLTVAPTGTISLFADCSSGIEPVFSLVSQRKTFYEDNKDNPGRTLEIVDPVFQAQIASLKINPAGDCFDKLPLDLRKVFVTTHDIGWEWHVRIQAAWQKYFDSAISKTINFPNKATVEEVGKAYLLSWRLGCKGITIYRDQSRKNQVLTSKKEENFCPSCRGIMQIAEGCATCSNCGYSACELTH